MSTPRMLTLPALLLAGCSLTMDPDSVTVRASDEISRLGAIPGNGQVSVSWSPTTGQTSFNVYYGSTPSVTTAQPKVTVTGPPAVVPDLTNGTTYYFAVSAVTERGEGPLSTVACAVPTAAATAGLSLHDPLCGSALDGSKWHDLGAHSVGVSGGAAVLSVDVANQEPRSRRGVSYSPGITVSAAGRVTTLKADILVPPGTAVRTGGAQVRATLRLAYQPPAFRLVFPGGNRHVLSFEVGLVDEGQGMKAYRSLTHCDDAACVAPSASGIAFTDPAEFSALAVGRSGAPASEGTTYTATMTLDESTGLFHWTIAGGTFGGGVSGTADPSQYLAATAAWADAPITGTGFSSGQLMARTFDASSDGGGSGRITAKFDNVHVGLDGGAATLFDDFNGVAPNSGPTEVSLAKWGGGGSGSVAPSGGKLRIHSQATSDASAVMAMRRLSLADPAAFNTLQADIEVPSSAVTGSGSVSVAVQGNFYNDGTMGSAPSSALGDIIADVILYPATSTAGYRVLRCPNATCAGALGVVQMGTLQGVTLGAGVHTVLLRWDPSEKTFTFDVDGAGTTVDPTTAAPWAGAANAPWRRIWANTSGSATPGTASVDVKVTNVFVAP